jgi:hypothetical protein
MTTSLSFFGRKGVYPCEWAELVDKFLETCLPPTECFVSQSYHNTADYSKLNQAEKYELEVDYKFAQKWKSLKEYLP